MRAKPNSHQEILRQLGYMPRAMRPRKEWNSHQNAIVARQLGCNLQTVQAWYVRNNIPSWQWRLVIELGHRRGRRITANLLLDTMPPDVGRKPRGGKTAFEEIAEGLGEALAIARGEAAPKKTNGKGGTHDDPIERSQMGTLGGRLPRRVAGAGRRSA